MPASMPAPTSYYSWPGYDFRGVYHEPVLLTIDGHVNSTLSLTLADLKAYPQHYASMTLDGTPVSGTGPYLMDLLDSAGLEKHANGVRIYYNGTTRTAPLSVLYLHRDTYVVAINSDNTLVLIFQGGDIDKDTWIDKISRLSILASD